MLVAVGAALFTIVSAYGFHDFLTSGDSVIRADPTRIAAQIVTGIGFLGAGAIIRQGLSVRGLTTAATLWVVAAIGMASRRGLLLGRGDHDVRRAGLPLAAADPRVPPLRAVPARDEAAAGRSSSRREPGAAARRRSSSRRDSCSAFEVGQEARPADAWCSTSTLPTGAEATDVVAELARLEQVLGVRWTD